MTQSADRASTIDNRVISPARIAPGPLNKFIVMNHAKANACAYGNNHQGGAPGTGTKPVLT